MRGFAGGLIITALVIEILALPAGAHQAPKSARIGVLWPVAEHPYLDAFRDGLRERGYTEGRSTPSSRGALLRRMRPSGPRG